MRVFANKLLSGQPVKIAAIGGSVTAGRGANQESAMYTWMFFTCGFCFVCSFAHLPVPRAALLFRARSALARQRSRPTGLPGAPGSS